MPKTPGVLASLKPKFSLPAGAKKAFPVAAVTFVCTWAVGGFYQAYSPALTHENLHSTSAVAAALVFASLMAPSSIGASLASRLKSRFAQLYGMVSFAIFMIGLVITLAIASLPSFLVVSVLAGIAQGMVLTGSIQSMVRNLEPAERANVFSVIYATSYIGAAVPTFIVGQFAAHLGLLNTTAGYAGLAIIGALVVLAFGAWRKKEA